MGWQGSTVRAILEIPRDPGVFGRWTTHEMLLDPDDVAAGYVVRFRTAMPVVMNPPLSAREAAAFLPGAGTRHAGRCRAPAAEPL
jgi:hypothetical protein